jgi:hypothetical protein
MADRLKATHYLYKCGGSRGWQHRPSKPSCGFECVFSCNERLTAANDHCPVCNSSIYIVMSFAYVEGARQIVWPVPEVIA